RGARVRTGCGATPRLAAGSGGVSRPRVRDMAAAYPVPGGEPVAIDGRCFAYVFPCAWEDHCKIGFSGDPLGRISALHPRWFGFFDLEAGIDRKSTRLNSSHVKISYAVFCLK